MNFENVHYDAFISYRHCDVDMFVAKNLHKVLESFKLPKFIRKQNPELPAKISRVFRDQEELPLTSNLADPILEALKNSDSLIVICSPRLKESIWCAKEIETFISLHGRSRVFAVLAEGEPSESFPPQLLVNENGEPMEPLAADFRGKTKSEIHKKMKTESLRLLAPMFGLNYDDLRQRHREQRMKRIMTVGAFAAAAVLAFGIYSYTTAMKIKNQAEEIKQKSTEIAEQNIEIRKKSDEILRQYKLTQEKYAITMASTVNDIMSAGRYMDALYIIRNAMPSMKTADDYPYTPNAEYALTDILQVYDSGNRFVPSCNYDAFGNVTNMILSPAGTKLLIVGSAKRAYLYDTQSDSLIGDFFVGLSTYGDEGFSFASENEIFMHDDDGEFIYNIESKEKLYVTDKSAKLSICADRGIALLYNYKGLTAYDYVSKKTLWFRDLMTETLLFSTFSENGDSIALYLAEGLSINNENHVEIVDTMTGEGIAATSLDGYSVSSMCSGGGRFYISLLKQVDVISYENYLMALDSSDASVIYMSKLLNVGVRDLFFFRDDGAEFLFGQSSDTVYSLDAATGEILSTGEISNGLIASYPISDNGSMLLITSDGSLPRYLASKGALVKDSLYAFNPTGYIRFGCFVKGNVYLYRNGENYVTKYSGTNPQNTVELGSRIGNGSLSANGVVCLDADHLNNTYTTYEVASKTQYASVTDEGDICAMSDDGVKFLVYGDEANLYNTADGAKLKSVTMDGLSGLFMYNSTNLKYVGAKVIDTSAHDIQVWDIETGQKTSLAADIGKGLNYSEWLINNSGTRLYGLTLDGRVVSRYNAGEPETPQMITWENDNANDIVLSDDDKFLFISYADGKLEIRDSESLDIVKTLYDCDKNIKKVWACPAINGYVVMGSDGYILNENLDMVGKINDLVGYDSIHDYFVLESNRSIICTERYDYSDLITIADEVLGDYEPSKSIVDRYGIEKNESVD